MLNEQTFVLESLLYIKRALLLLLDRMKYIHEASSSLLIVELVSSNSKKSIFTWLISTDKGLIGFLMVTNDFDESESFKWDFGTISSTLVPLLPILPWRIYPSLYLLQSTIAPPSDKKMCFNPSIFLVVCVPFWRGLIGLALEEDLNVFRPSPLFRDFNLFTSIFVIRSGNQ